MRNLIKALTLSVSFLMANTALANPLPGSEWGPNTLNGEVFTPEAEIFLRFEQDGRFFGNGGCNTFRGQFVTNGDAILFGPAATTMMACPDGISQQEFAFLQALNSVRFFKRDGITLQLSDENQKEVLTFQQRDAD